MNKRLVLIVIVFTFVAGLFIGGFLVLSASLDSTVGKLVDKKVCKNAFQAGLDTAEERLRNAGFAKAPEEITSITGFVKEVAKDIITLTVSPLNPLEDPDLTLRVVKIDEQTKIYQMKEKEVQIFQKEQEDYDKALRGDQSVPLQKPDPYAKKQVLFSNITQGAKIIVTAEQDIKAAKTFIAQEILIQTPVIPASQVVPGEGMNYY